MVSLWSTEAIPKPGPAFNEPDHLGEMHRICRIALADKVDVRWHARHERLAVVLENQIAAPLWTARIQDWHESTSSPVAMKFTDTELGRRLAMRRLPIP